MAVYQGREISCSEHKHTLLFPSADREGKAETSTIPSASWSRLFAELMAWLAPSPLAEAVLLGRNTGTTAPEPTLSPAPAPALFPVTFLVVSVLPGVSLPAPVGVAVPH